jgi:hypothetical protein
MAERLCGPECCEQDKPHRDPAPDWIGDYPVIHGESDDEVPGTRRFNGLYTEGPDMWCLCGHPNYLTCPGWYRGEGTVFGMTIQSAEETQQ